MHKGNINRELYDLERDSLETNDISGMHPDVIAKVNEIVTREHVTSPNKRWQFSLLDNK